MMRWSLATLVVLSFSLPVSAAVSSDGSRVASVFVKGEIVNSMMTVSIRPGLGVTKAVRVYTEPSHTLVAAIVDDPVASASDGAWYEATFGRLAATQRDVPVLHVPLRENEAFIVSTLAPPIEDVRFNVVLNGTWDDGDGKVTEREVSFFMTTRLTNFAFTYTRVLRDSADESPAFVSDVDLRAGVLDLPRVPRGILHRRFRLQPLDEICCGEGTQPGCRRVCVSCSGQNYTCCNETEEMSGCGWCNKVVAYCKSQLCSQC